MAHEHYKVNDRQIVAQLVEDELIAIHQEKGTYYSLRGSGPEIWALIEKGASLDELVQFYATSYQDKQQACDIEALIAEFCQRLQNEGLISLEQADPPKALLISPLDSTLIKPINVGTFEPPTLEAFDDMKEYLLIDPIHKVDESGWPNQKA